MQGRKAERGLEVPITKYVWTSGVLTIPRYVRVAAPSGFDWKNFQVQIGKTTLANRSLNYDMRVGLGDALRIQFHPGQHARIEYINSATLRLTAVVRQQRKPARSDRLTRPDVSC